MPACESDSQWQCSQLMTKTGDSTCEHVLHALQVFSVELKLVLPFFSPQIIFSLCEVSFTAMEICIFTENSHACCHCCF